MFFFDAIRPRNYRYFSFYFALRTVVFVFGVFVGVRDLFEKARIVEWSESFETFQHGDGQVVIVQDNWSGIGTNLFFYSVVWLKKGRNSSKIEVFFEIFEIFETFGTESCVIDVIRVYVPKISLNARAPVRINSA